jgi:hypothetical protein
MPAAFLAGAMISTLSGKQEQAVDLSALAAWP